MAPLIRELSDHRSVDCRVCVTGQHREILSQVLGLFGICPDWDLDVMHPNQTLASLTGAMLGGVTEILRSFAPDRVIVQGDTTSTIVGALAAFYQKVPVAHVEAGLRTRNIYAPWPEEMNRRLVAQIADLHFAPTPRARENLVKEGVDVDSIVVTGNTGIDALLAISALLDCRPDLGSEIEMMLSEFAGKRIILVTGHRRESFGGSLDQMCRAIARIAARKDVAIIYPVHPNPNVRRSVEVLRGLDSVRLTEPLDYSQLILLLKRSHFVVTDSGGIQEEAPFLGKPVLVTRDTTERPEAIEAGCAKLVGTNEKNLVAQMSQLLDDPEVYRAMSRVINVYGDGKASPRIVARLLAGEEPSRLGRRKIKPSG